MKLVIQRVAQAAVTIDTKIHAQIEGGLLVFIGITHTDTEEDVAWLTQKLMGLRIFGDATGAMNYSVAQVEGAILVISQFTLYASTKKGNRPSFLEASQPKHAIPLYEHFLTTLSRKLPQKVKSGIFGAQMEVSLVNDGPVTIIIDSKNRI